MTTILHVIDTTGPGGGETIFIELIRRLDPARWHSIAAIPGPGWVADTLRTHGVSPVFTPVSGRGFDLRYLWRLIGVIRRHRADLIQTHFMGAAVYACLAGFLTRVPVVCTLHGTVDVEGSARRRAWKWWVASRGAARIVFVSAALRDAVLAGAGVNPAKVTVIPNGIDLDEFATRRATGIRRELGLDPEESLITAIGNIRRPKAYEVLVKAAAILRGRSPAYRFAIAGEGHGTLLDELTALRTDLALDDAVTFLGFRPDVPSVLAESDLLVSSSRSEGFSLSVIQALACGVPVVATRSGGPEEILTDGVDGLLVPVDAPERLADAMERVLGDVNLRRRLTEAGSRTVRERYAVGRMVADYAALYDRHARRIVPTSPA